MNLAYADPPYLGMGSKMYGALHPEAHVWDSVDSHIDLLHRLDAEYDGWAFSMTSTSLPQIAGSVPSGARFAAWVKPFAAWRPNQRIQYTWEPVVFKSARPKGGRDIPSVRDFLSARIAMRKGLRGAKPDEFNDWILQLLGYQVGDEFTDLFPGTNGMSEAVARLQGVAA